jgi:hypothetical protein
MESLNTLVELITCTPLTCDESYRMTKAIIKIRELILFAETEEKEKQKDLSEMITLPCNR